MERAFCSRRHGTKAIINVFQQKGLHSTMPSRSPRGSRDPHEEDSHELARRGEQELFQMEETSIHRRASYEDDDLLSTTPEQARTSDDQNR